MGEQPGGVPPVAAARMRAGLTLEPEFDDVRIAGRYHNAEDFKQGAKIDKASVRQGGCVGTLLKIPLC
jgi:hypothetical protein